MIRKTLAPLRWLLFGGVASLLVYATAVASGMGAFAPADVLVLGGVEHVDGLDADAPTPVVLVHGLGRGSLCMWRLGRGLEAHGYTVRSFGYPSARRHIREHAAELQRFLVALDGSGGSDEPVDLVAHSMGCLVARAQQALPGARPVRRMVCLGSPQQGSALAERLQDNALFKLLLGSRSVRDLVPGSDFLRALPAPSVPLGLVAGAQGNDRGLNPWLEGDDDGTVRLDEARLEGAAGFVTVPRSHSGLLVDATARTQVLHFLKHGRFQ